MSLSIRVKLTHKIAAIGGAGVIGLLLVGGLYLNGSATQSRYQKTADDAGAAIALTRELLMDMLEARRGEKDFLLRNDEKYLANQSRFAKAAEGKLTKLKQRLVADGHADLAGKVDAISTGYATYINQFAILADAKRVLGLNQNSGLEGTLRNSVHAIEAKLKDIGDFKLDALMLTMRRHEKDFMLRRDARYGDEMKKAAAAFAAALDASAVPAAVKNEISAKLGDYQRDFFAWMAAAQAIVHAQTAMTENYGKIEPIIDAIVEAVQKIDQSAKAANAASRAETTTLIQIAILVILVLMAAFAFLVGRSVSKPLSAMTKAMADLANGNFDVVLPGLGRRDEIGEMAQAVETFKLKAVEKAQREAEQKEAEARAAAAQRKADMHKLADSFEAAVGNIIDTVSSASTELEAAATTLTKTAEVTQQLSTMVASASEEASSNVQSVASASEEMAASTGEISRQVQESATIARGAVTQAEKTNVRITELSQAAQQIGEVLNLITTIAEQTNLLALNATIEAARAGEAGRGFAVVAQEVKALAAQTAKATSEIGAQITGMQNATRESVGAIKEITGTIARISEITETIAAAVEEQGAATQEISRNVQQAAQGTAQVAVNITDVNKGAGETGSASTQVLSSAQSLASESNHLKVEVQRFLATVRAA